MQMISDAEVRLAEWIIKHVCRENKFCFNCPHKDNCKLGKCPDDWNIPKPSPEPVKRQRIEWLRMLPDEEMLKALDTFSIKNACADCRELGMEYECKGYNHCFIGHMDWWHEVVSLERFRKDVGLE